MDAHTTCDFVNESHPCFPCTMGMVLWPRMSEVSNSMARDGEEKRKGRKNAANEGWSIGNSDDGSQKEDTSTEGPVRSLF